MSVDRRGRPVRKQRTERPGGRYEHRHPHNRITSQSAGTAAETAQLFERWQQHGDEAAREQLVARYMPLARSLARRYGRSSEPFEDLLQVASLGSAQGDRPLRRRPRHPFQSFAVPTILGEMRRYFRDSGWAIHVPRGAQERALKVRDAQERLSNETGRAPTVNQLAEYLELDAEEVIDALQAIRAYETVSLDAPARRRRRGHRALRRHDRRRRRALRARRARRDRQRGARPTSPRETGWCCSCASSRT